MFKASLAYKVNEFRLFYVEFRAVSSCPFNAFLVGFFEVFTVPLDVGSVRKEVNIVHEAYRACSDSNILAVV